MADGFEDKGQSSRALLVKCCAGVVRARALWPDYWGVTRADFDQTTKLPIPMVADPTLYECKLHGSSLENCDFQRPHFATHPLPLGLSVSGGQRVSLPLGASFDGFELLANTTPDGVWR